MKNKVCQKYLRDIGKNLSCSAGVKHVLLHDFAERIYCYEAEVGEASYDKLCVEFGAPEDIAKSFEGAALSDNIRSRAKKYFVTKIIAVALAVALVAVTALLIYIIKEASGTTVVSDAYESVSGITNKITYKK
ncbi:MAG: hypothetical protein IJY27_01785 [Clostridia bacterium]|nr:hypothetical protein [Clostridia bacterium]